MKTKKNFICVITLCTLVLASCGGDGDDPMVIPTPSAPTTPISGDIDINFSFDYVNSKDSRPLMQSNSFSQQQKDSLQTAFTQEMGKVNGKRSKVVTAATFLVSLKCRVPYGHEWKVTDTHDYDYVGRYTKKGLFLNEFVENGSTHKPWGEMIPTHPRYPRQNIKNLGDEYENGLHCSSYIGWCLFNGNAVTDVALLEKTYANDYRTFPSTKELALKGNVDLIRVGDLIGFPGHIAIVIGIKGDLVVYASAEGGSAYPGKGISWLTFNKKTIDFDKFTYKYFIQMNKVYGD
ncbi:MULTISPECIES: hypothetical protein [unclassified Prevotella]|uniref:hypothetical protein n=1 Tax=unclassified Prevotella TaxID=2638335 RepID=UPI0008D0C27B|nr:MULTISPECIES: hypothetical protein [unclassified Prevotella]SES68071.1 hypothetical protein SAMN04487825_10217 [Prevotella sp. kh1p2]SFF81657.1 hypothetical protein SAMN05216383_10152 [Prevotella sp. KH2C16]SNU10255.1 hypothetical protein SAMN06298210_10216 [Prevotellaceae bacterium KH2P17]